MSSQAITHSEAVLITGGSGYLGTALAELCAAKGCLLIGVDANPPRSPSLWHRFQIASSEAADYHELLAGHRVAYVFHLAGSASVPQSVAAPLSDFQKLLPGTAALLNYLRKEQPESHAVLFSSAAVYGNPVALPVSEDHAARPISPYGVHKLVAETLWMHTARINGLRASALRIFSAYGAGLRKQIFWDLVQKFQAWRAGHAPDVEIFGTGDESRDFVHGRDIARAALAIAERSPGDIYNVGTGEEVTIRAAALMLLGREVPLRFTGKTRAGDPDRWRADISCLRGLGWKPEIEIEKALPEYLVLEGNALSCPKPGT